MMMNKVYQIAIHKDEFINHLYDDEPQKWSFLYTYKFINHLYDDEVFFLFFMNHHSFINHLYDDEDSVNTYRKRAYLYKSSI